MAQQRLRPHPGEPSPVSGYELARHPARDTTQLQHQTDYCNVMPLRPPVLPFHEFDSYTRHTASFPHLNNHQLIDHSPKPAPRNGVVIPSRIIIINTTPASSAVSSAHRKSGSTASRSQNQAAEQVSRQSTTLTLPTEARSTLTSSSAAVRAPKPSPSAVHSEADLVGVQTASKYSTSENAQHRALHPSWAYYRPRIPRKVLGYEISCAKCNGWGGLEVIRPIHPSEARSTTVDGNRILATKCYVCRSTWPSSLKRLVSARQDADLVQAATMITCDTCTEQKRKDRFPVLITLRCDHQQTTCLRCLRGWIEAQIDDGIINIACPGRDCDQELETSDVQRQASTEVYQRYLDLALKRSLSKDASFKYCVNAMCSSGQYVTDDSQEFVCDGCQMTFCLAHDPMVHYDGETCGAYNARIANKRKHDQAQENDDASQAEVKRIATECPGCKVQIQKFAGCDHMTCVRCKYEFCYVCGAEYNAIREHGNTEHKEDCRYHSSNLDPEYDWVRRPRPAPRQRAPATPGTRASGRLASRPAVNYAVLAG